MDSLIAEYEEIRLPLKKRRETYITQFPILMKSLTTESSIFLCIWQQRVLWEAVQKPIKRYTIDKKTGEAVSLGELLGNEETLRLVSENISAQMEEQMKEDASVVYFQASEGGFSGLTGDESFYLNQDGSLVVVFDEYTIAPGSMGMVEFTIPTETAGAFR